MLIVLIFLLAFPSMALSTELTEFSALQLKEKAAHESWGIVCDEIFDDKEKLYSFEKKIGSGDESWLGIYFKCYPHLDGLFAYLADDALAGGLVNNPVGVLKVFKKINDRKSTGSNNEVVDSLRFCGMTPYDLENDTPVNRMLANVFSILYKQREVVSNVNEESLDDVKNICLSNINGAISDWLDFAKSDLKGLKPRDKGKNLK